MAALRGPLARRSAVRDQAQLPAETRWTGSGLLDGKTILLLAEQGFGDTVQFCRYAADGRATGRPCDPGGARRAGAVDGTLDGVDSVVSQDDPLPAFDCVFPLLSLPLAFGTTEATIPSRVPYLEADAAMRSLAVDYPAARRRGGLRIGLVWAGARRADQPHAAGDRSAALDARWPKWRRWRTVPGYVFVSLQVGPPAKQTATRAISADRRHRAADRFRRDGGVDRGIGSGDRRRYLRRACGGRSGQAGLAVEPAMMPAGVGRAIATTARGIRPCGSSARARPAIGPG